MASTSDRLAEDKRLLSRIDDLCDRCEREYCQRFIGFLDERQTAYIRPWMERRGRDLQWRFYGGHEDAERVFLGISGGADLSDDALFPLQSLELCWRKGVTLTHRDVLGSLMGCGIAREKIGDILCEDGRAVVFVTEELAPYLGETLDTVGREGVRVACPASVPFPIFHRFRELTATVASARLDSVVKALIGTSREQACDLIRKGLVQRNHTEVLSVSTSVEETDVISVRGYGRYRVDSVSELSKKGRVILRARQYV